MSRPRSTAARITSRLRGSPRLAAALAVLMAPALLLAPAAPGYPPAGAAAIGAANPDVPPPMAATVRASAAALPLSFIPNAGQSDASVHFQAQGAGHNLLLGASSMTLLSRSASDSPLVRPDRSASGRVDEALRRGQKPPQLADTPAALDTVSIGFPGARAGVAPVGEEPLPGFASFFFGDDPSAWRAGLPTFAAVRYPDLYPGIDMVYRGHVGRLKSEWVVAPSASPSLILIEYSGDVTGVQVDAAGALHIATPAGELIEAAPESYQTIGGERVAVPSSYALIGERTIGFTLGNYDAARPLVIDPVLSYSSFLGGNGDDIAYGVAVDSAGNAYITGSTASTDFPITGSAQAPRTGTKSPFVTKVNAAGNGLVYSLYFGGSSNDEAYGIAVDGGGSAYVTGSTYSPNFPISPGTFQATFPSTPDRGSGFVTKINPQGTQLTYSSYLGGSGSDWGAAIAVDSAGNAYVTGASSSTNFPTSASAYQRAPRSANPSFNSVFVTKINPQGSGLLYSTYVGGGGDDTGLGIAIDASGNAYVAGITTSPDFPVTPGAFQTRYLGGDTSGFVLKLNPLGSGLVWNTFLSGSASDAANAVAVDSGGNAYVTGITDSVDFPVTTNAFQPNQPGGTGAAFVTKVAGGGNGLVYSSYLGGSSVDEGTGIAIDGSGNAYVTGYTSSPNFPTVNALQTSADTLTAFVTKVNPQGTGLNYSTYLGGSGEDRANAIAVGPAGNAFVVGTTSSSTFPIVGGFQAQLRGGFTTAFIAKIGDTGAAGAPLVPPPPTPYRPNNAPAQVVWQQTNTPVAGAVQIGVRDKWGTLGQYTVQFRVRATIGGRPFEAVSAPRQVIGEAWSQVFYPNDFSANGGTGTYTWEAVVNGAAVVTDTFFYQGNQPSILPGLPQVVWQQSQERVGSNQIMLGLRDRNGTLRQYDAIFTVRAANGQQTSTVRRTLGDAWAFVLFPSDFGVAPVAGAYTWSAQVSNQVVVNGTFTFP